MNRDDVTRWARETGLIVDSPYLMPHDHVMHGIERFAKAAYAAGAAAEREACAKVCEDGVDTEHPTVKGHIMEGFGQSSLLAKAIRARGEAK